MNRRLLLRGGEDELGQEDLDEEAAQYLNA